MRRDPEDLIPLAYRRYKAAWMRENGMSFKELGDAFRAFVSTLRKAGAPVSGQSAALLFEEDRRNRGLPVWLSYGDFRDCVFSDPDEAARLLSAEEFATYCYAGH